MGNRNKPLDVAAHNSLRSRVIALAILLILVAAAGIFAIAPHLRTVSLEKEALSMTQLHAALGRRLRRLSLEAAGHNGAKAAGPTETVFIAGDTVGIVGAELHKLVANLIRRHGGKVKALLVLPSRPKQNPNMVSASVTANITVKGLRETIYQIETSLPLLFIDKIAISAQRALRSRPVNGPVRLDVQMQVSAFRKERVVF